MKCIRGTEFAATALLAAASLAALCGCSGVKLMPVALKAQIAASDTVYLFPSQARFVHKGFLFNRPDSARSAAIAASADSILELELARAFPDAPVRRVAEMNAGANAAPENLVAGKTNVVALRCDIDGFARTLPREIVSEALDIILMVPTYAFNMGYPIETTSDVYLRVYDPHGGKPVRLKHTDMVDAGDVHDLQFQIRKILDPAYRG